MFNIPRLLLATFFLTTFSISPSFGQVAKSLFGVQRLPSLTDSESYGFYSNGCVSGAIALPANGPSWQVMRLSRNRYWGHPTLINRVLTLSTDAKKLGWNGLLIGDLSQPRGGPMLTGHISHQIGLDVDIWLNEMPSHKMSRLERERRSAQSVLNTGSDGKIDQTRIGSTFSQAHFNMIRLAASYADVERILVHPAIKQELCRLEGSLLKRRWLHKVRPYWGHHYHMHVRMRCPLDSPNCRPQDLPRRNDGCGYEISRWMRMVSPSYKSPFPPPKKRKELLLTDLPQACSIVLDDAAPASADLSTARVKGGKIIIPTPKK